MRTALTIACLSVAATLPAQGITIGGRSTNIATANNITASAIPGEFYLFTTNVGGDISRITELSIYGPPVFQHSGLPHYMCAFSCVEAAVLTPDGCFHQPPPAGTHPGVNEARAHVDTYNYSYAQFPTPVTPNYLGIGWTGVGGGSIWPPNNLTPEGFAFRNIAPISGVRLNACTSPPTITALAMRIRIHFL